MRIGLDNDRAASDWIWDGLRLLVEGKGLRIGVRIVSAVGTGRGGRRVCFYEVKWLANLVNDCALHVHRLA